MGVVGTRDITPTPRSGGKKLAALASFAIPAVFVVAFLFLLLSVRNSAEAAVANVAGLLPIGYAFAAGMVASVNPCGFFLLPSYISYHLGTEEAGFYQTSLPRRALKAVIMGVVATLGFILVFAGIGTFIALGGRWLARVFPYGGVAIGVAMVGLGLWLLATNRTMGLMAASRVTVSPRRNLRNVFLFGIAYAVGSLGCTLPVFLVVVGSALATQGLLTSLGQFVGYALGMGSILVAVTIGSALFRGTVARWLEGATPYVHRASALFLVGAGAYLIYYWVFFARFFF
ncbi:MAG: cytochrome c biogenesis protein CcdA [Chloroflexi bacterium]|nr:cytochrome c biogenesis protein CcdA [Chloroflexota bacterium]